MLADRAPSSWLASQTSHCAAAVVASSVENAAVQARSRMPASRKRGLVVDDEPVTLEMGDCRMSASRRSAGEVATWGIGVGLLSGFDPW